VLEVELSREKAWSPMRTDPSPLRERVERSDQKGVSPVKKTSPSKPLKKVASKSLSKTQSFATVE
jgi:hypothetical protein